MDDQAKEWMTSYTEYDDNKRKYRHHYVPDGIQATPLLTPCSTCTRGRHLQGKLCSTYISSRNVQLNKMPKNSKTTDLYYHQPCTKQKKVTDEKKRMPQWRSEKLSEGKQWPSCLDRVQHQRLPQKIQWTNPLRGKKRHRTLFIFFRRQLRLSRDYIGGRKREALGRISKKMWVSFREGIFQSTEGRFSGSLLTRFNFICLFRFKVSEWRAWWMMTRGMLLIEANVTDPTYKQDTQLASNFALGFQREKFVLVRREHIAVPLQSGDIYRPNQAYLLSSISPTMTRRDEINWHAAVWHARYLRTNTGGRAYEWISLSFKHKPLSWMRSNETKDQDGNMPWDTSDTVLAQEFRLGILLICIHRTQSWRPFLPGTFSSGQPIKEGVSEK